MLRRVKALPIERRAIGPFIGFMEPQFVRQFTQIVKQGDPMTALYLVLEGELRVRLLIGGKETILATVRGGRMFWGNRPFRPRPALGRCHSKGKRPLEIATDAL